MFSPLPRRLVYYMGLYGAWNACQCLMNGTGSALVTYIGTQASTRIHHAALTSLLRAPLRFVRIFFSFFFFSFRRIPGGGGGAAAPPRPGAARRPQA